MTDTATASVVSEAVRDGVALIVSDSPPVNALGYAVRSGLYEALGRAIASDAVKAIVIACDGRTFFAGADIAEFTGVIAGPGLNNIYARMDASPKPIVAAIHGTALGGGLELALACHYRVAAADAKLGLPEVQLGLLPGAGGTQRTPRLVGVAAAVDLMLSGRPVGAPKAKEIGLIDAVADDNLREAAIAMARKAASEGGLPRTRDRAPDITAAAASAFFARVRADHAASFVGYKAPGHILRAIEASTRLPFDEGRAVEQALFEELMESSESLAQRHIFFAERAAAKVPGIGREVRPLASASVSVLGDGDRADALRRAFETLSLPVVSDGAAADLIVVADPMADIDAVAERTGRSEGVIGLHLPPVAGNRLLEIGRGPRTGDVALATALALARKLGRVPVVSSGTPGLIGTRALAAGRAAADSLREEGASARAIDRAMTGFGFPPGLFGPVEGGGEGSESGDAAIVRRLLAPIVNEGARIVEDGVALRASDVDVAMVLGFGWPAWQGGPLFWADLAGLKSVVATLEQGSGADGVSPLLRRLAAENGSFHAA
ncbi:MULTISPECIES: enoyl-CoA hydratase-related protein [unclassified Sphingomonas]|uniref:enoyl-CoA hydratase-related protein n=1 Tax=unclassified Sphingomonas TaxID=196159 RepID=UPI0009ECBC26|nr:MULTISPECIES: enoyl-CoA hydratase-related protein [unclassified Sphingomonas]